MTDDQRRRLAILANPTETPRIECKSWLDLADNHDKAVFAKATIAMANSGGGTIVFGISENNADGKRLTCVPRPQEIQRYTSDAIGSAINKYADPALDFTLEFETNPDTGDEYAFVEIHGDMLQPVFAKKSYDGVLKKLTCYVRKPGPKSEEPHTAQEWRDLLNRCVRASRDSMLDSIRTIMDGRPMDTTPTQSDEEQLREFMAASKACWQELLQEVEENDVARLQRGYWAFAFSIVGGETWSTLNELRIMLQELQPGGASAHFFRNGYSQTSQPYATQDAIEAWTGDLDPSDSYYWRATPAGEFYYLEGYFEDSLGFPGLRTEPGTVLFLDLSIELHARMLKLATRIAKTVGEDAEIVICSQMTGLKRRYLTSKPGRWRRLVGEWFSSMDTVTSKPRCLTPQQIDDNLVEVLYDFLYPLYEKFNFFELSRGWVEAALKDI